MGTENIYIHASLKAVLQHTRIKVIVSSTEFDSKSIYVNYLLQKSSTYNGQSSSRGFK